MRKNSQRQQHMAYPNQQQSQHTERVPFQQITNLQERENRMPTQNVANNCFKQNTQNFKYGIGRSPMDQHSAYVHKKNIMNSETLDRKQLERNASRESLALLGAVDASENKENSAAIDILQSKENISAQVNDDYLESLHCKITQNLSNQVQILNQTSKNSVPEEYCLLLKQSKPPFAFGTTQLSDYRQIDVLGKGTYGEVTKCMHTKTNTLVALKTFLFENVSNGINYSTMREISILKQLDEYPNFVRLLDVLEEFGTESNKIHCVFEYCEATLFQRLAKRDKPLEWSKIKSIMRQVLKAVNILHGKMILHRDIKPENILIAKDGCLKLADFGLAKKASFLQRRKSNSIVSLWYRAPEIILGSEDYLLGVDMWSIGCLFGELMQSRPVFYCKSDAEVLDKAFKILGTPTQSHCPFFHKLKKWNNFKFRQHEVPASLKDAFPYGTPEALDLLSKLLALDPKKRITAKQALVHPFFDN